jgi:hypothetical protein
MAYATTLTPVAGATVADPTTAAALVWTTVANPTAFVIIHNTSTTDPVYLVTAADATSSGRAVGPGGTAAFGPYLKGQALWLKGPAADPVRYSFDGVAREV